MRAQQQLFETAILEVRAKHGFERQECREQGRDPDHAGANGLEHLRFRPQAERKNERDHKKEQNGIGGLGAVPPEQEQIALNDPGASVG